MVLIQISWKSLNISPTDFRLTFSRDLSGFSRIQTFHPLDLRESNIVSILQSMSGLIHAGHEGIFALYRQPLFTPQGTPMKQD